MTGRIRIASYNIHKARGMDGRVNVQRIVRVLREIDADIVALQEVVSHDDTKAEERHQARFLAAQLDRHFSVGETRRHLGGAYGNVTLSRWTIENAGLIDVTVAGCEPRGILRTDLNVGGRALHVFNAHLGTGFFERRRQAEQLLKDKPLDPPERQGPRVVLGDFNEWTHGVLTTALRAEFHERNSHAFVSSSYPGLLPLLNLDHMYCDGDLGIVSVRTHRSPLALVASDHLPLVADLQWD